MSIPACHPKGSQWRIWDLHVHTPASSDGGDYADFITKASTCVASVIGINDYCTLAGYEEIVRLGGVPDKVLFPVVELRMNNLLQTKRNPNGVRVNFHIIFDNDPAVFSKIKTWISSLPCYGECAKNTQLGAVHQQDLQKVSFDYEAVVASLKELELYGTHALIWLPYDEYGGADEIDPIRDGMFKAALIGKAHIMGSSTAKQIEFFKFQDPKHTLDQYRAWFDRPRPCIKGSDAHENGYPFGCLQDKDSKPTDKYCWINADTTFEGLKQIVNEPDRVYIGEEPLLLQRIKANKTKFIHSLKVDKTSGATLTDTWFKDFSIELNSGLVAIIGSKGGGKSAITDIISLCGNTHQKPENFSFLTKDKFRRPKPENLSDKFEATLQWADGTEERKLLSQNPDKTFPERIKYIPQHFLEQLCSHVDSNDFEEQLKQIIFSHTPADKRLGKSSLDELINYRSDIVVADIAQIRQELSALNLKIVELETKATSEFRFAVENQIKLKQGELFAHDGNKPLPPHAENAEADSQQAVINQLSELRTRIAEFEKGLGGLTKEKGELAIQKEELTRTAQFYLSLQEQLQKTSDPANEFAAILIKNGIDANAVFQYAVNVAPISALIEKVAVRKIAIDAMLDKTVEGTVAFQCEQAKMALLKGQEELDKPAKAQQKYLDDLREWEKKKIELEGTAATEGTLNFLTKSLDYLTNTLSSEITGKYDERNELARRLYGKKGELLAIRKELFQPVMHYIDNFKELKERYAVNIDVSLEVRSFPESFFSFIGQNKTGTYQGKEDGYKRLYELLDKSQFETADDFILFTEEILSTLYFDKRSPEQKPVSITNQLRQGAELSRLYDFLFGAEYIQPVYSLKLGNKTLQQLSPGERGALLLIFYLILDKDDIPLIIDQPEENLDNESVYYILVHFIKKTKETRQIIIVTHNPNLAVVCDADQIIHMQIDKEHKNGVHVLSGSIENPEINRSVINVLEGTLPAFNNRDSKYLKNQPVPLAVIKNSPATEESEKTKEIGTGIVAPR